MNQIMKIDNLKIRTDEEGRFCLNDLHKAAGNEKRHSPSYWLNNQQTKELIDEIAVKFERPVSVIKGRSRGTYVCRPLIYDYATWIGGAKVAAYLAAELSQIEAIISALNEFEAPEDLPDMFVYAIREQETGRVKIGISRDPEKRLLQLQTGNSQKLELISMRKAHNRFDDESALHRAHYNVRIRSEWFDGSVGPDCLEGAA